MQGFRPISRRACGMRWLLWCFCRYPFLLSQVFPLLDQHFFQLIPVHMYECFLDQVAPMPKPQVQHRDIVLGALCAWGGRPLWHHWKAAHAVHHPVLPKTYQEVQSPEICRQGWYHKSFKWNAGKQQVLIPSICCLHKSTALEELYLEKADSAAITTYLLAHTLKHLNNLRVLALPKQCDDDVASIIGISCTT